MPPKKTNPISKAITIVPEKTPTDLVPDNNDIASLLRELNPKAKAFALAVCYCKTREDIARAASSTPGTYDQYMHKYPALKRTVHLIREMKEHELTQLLINYNTLVNAPKALQRREEILTTPYKHLKSDADKRTQSTQIDATLKGAGVDKVTPTIGNQYNYTEILAKEININGWYS